MQPISLIMTIAAMEFAGRVSKITAKFSASPLKVDLTPKKTRRKTAFVYSSANEIAAACCCLPQSKSQPSLPVSFEEAPKIDLDFEVFSIPANHNSLTLEAWGFVPLSPIMEISERKPSFELIVTPATPIDESNPYFPENDNFGHFVVDEEGNWHWAAVDMNHLSPQWKTSKVDTGFPFTDEKDQIIHWLTVGGDDTGRMGDNQGNSDDDELGGVTLHELLMSEHIQGQGKLDYC